MTTTTEKTIIHTVEITKIVPANDPVPLLPVKKMNQLLCDAITKTIDCDQAQVIRCQIFIREDHHE